MKSHRDTDTNTVIIFACTHWYKALNEKRAITITTTTATIICIAVITLRPRDANKWGWRVRAINNELRSRSISERERAVYWGSTVTSKNLCTHIWSWGPNAERLPRTWNAHRKASIDSILTYSQPSYHFFFSRSPNLNTQFGRSLSFWTSLNLCVHAYPLKFCTNVTSSLILLIIFRFFFLALKH